MWETVVSTYGCLGEGIGAISRASRGWTFQVGQKTGEQAKQRQVAAQVVHEEYAGAVGQSAEERGTDARDAEGQTEEQPCHHADLAGQEFLRMYQDGRAATIGSCR